MSVDNPAFSPPAGVVRRSNVVVVGSNQQSYAVPMAVEEDDREGAGGGDEIRAASSAVGGSNANGGGEEAKYVAPSVAQAAAYELGLVPGAQDHRCDNNNAANPVYEPPMAPPQRQGPVPPAAASASQSGPNYEEIDEVVDARTGTSSMQLADVEYAVAAEDGQQQYQPPPLQQLVLDGDGYVEGGSLPTAASSNSGLAVYAQPSASTTVYGESSSSA